MLKRLVVAAVFMLAGAHAFPELHEVVRVIDADTIVVRLGTVLERVRLVGVDAPETYPKSKTEPYGPEATAFVAELLAGGYVSLDLVGRPRDHYGRLLARVVAMDGSDVGLELLQAGLGDTMLADRPEYPAAVWGAASVGKGMWGARPFVDVNCSAFRYREVAQAFFEGASTPGRPDRHRLDPDHDGEACETLNRVPVPLNALPLRGLFQS